LFILKSIGSRVCEQYTGIIHT